MDKNLLHQERLFSAILNNVYDGIIAIDQKLSIMFINRAAERMIGWTNEKAAGKTAPQSLSVIEAQKLSPLIPGGLPQDETPLLFRNVILKSHIGETFIIEGSITKIQVPDDTGLPEYVMIFRDTSEMKRLSATVDFQAHHDALTGLLNRESFIPKLQEVLEDLRRTAGFYALLMFNIDQYQEIGIGNEVVAGDELLREAADIIRFHVQRRDISARLRDDIFVLILRDCTVEEAVGVVQRLRKAAGNLRLSSGASSGISLSIGLLALTDAYTDTNDVLHRADQACSEARQQGGDRLVIYGEH
ncbi:MAG: diguanylate cyclase [Spirochaetaceae bacterium]|jgi:diguanylate cyclase (GGDEF)-like protein/PAS domain S-box-containing protein|nr:diguanylate cyclase [Spirochaetaceae bacterium]